MDKFGIFNLLNSFLGLYEKNKTAPADNKDAFSDAAKPAPTAFTPQKQTKSVAETRAVSPPLQSGMLNVMHSHDEFIRRVKEKNKPPVK